MHVKNPIKTNFPLWRDPEIRNQPQQTIYTSLHETEAETTCDRITLNFECQDRSSLQIVVQKDVLDCVSLY